MEMEARLLRLVDRANETARVIKGYQGLIRVVSHYDCDGITSAAIMARALARARKRFHLSFVKQLHAAMIEELAKEEARLFLFLDFGSGKADELQAALGERALIVIADHHQLQGMIGIDREALEDGVLLDGARREAGGNGAAQGGQGMQEQQESIHDPGHERPLPDADERNGSRQQQGPLVREGRQQLPLQRRPENGKQRTSGQADQTFFHLNPLCFGIEEDISGSGMTYLLVRALSPENKDLSEIAILGAIGDSQMGSIGVHWGLLGLNQELLKEARASGKIKVERGLRVWGRTSRPVHKALEYSLEPFIPGVSGSESGAARFLQELGIALKKEDGSWRTLADLTEEETQRLADGIIKERIRGNQAIPEEIFGDIYHLQDKPQYPNANEFATLLNACGKTGNCFLGVALCLNDAQAFMDAKSILDSYRREIGKGLRWVEEHRQAVQATKRASYLHVQDAMSEHLLSNVLSTLHKNGFFPDLPVFGFVSADDGRVKVSARATDGFVERGLNLGHCIHEAAVLAKGEGGGHRGAAGATIPSDGVETFINSMEEILLSSHIAREIAHGQGQGRQESSEARSAQGIAAEAADVRGGKEKAVERKGLVRYLGA